MPEQPRFDKPTAIERVFNRVFGVLTGLGLGLKHNVLLLTVGRNSGRPRATPVNRLDIGADVYLVAPRGTAGWVLNARAAGRVTLKRGRERRNYRVEEITEADKAPILRTYLQRYTPTVQRYFPLKPDAGVDEFRAIAADYPVFRLVEEH